MSCGETEAQQSCGETEAQQSPAEHVMGLYCLLPGGTQWPATPGSMKYFEGRKSFFT